MLVRTTMSEALKYTAIQNDAALEIHICWGCKFSLFCHTSLSKAASGAVAQPRPKRPTTQHVKLLWLEIANKTP